MRRREWELSWKRPQSTVVQDTLLIVGIEVALDIIDIWCDKQVQDAEWWAWHEHARASDNPVRRYPKPSFLPEAMPFS